MNNRVQMLELVCNFDQASHILIRAAVVR